MSSRRVTRAELDRLAAQINKKGRSASDSEASGAKERLMQKLSNMSRHEADPPPPSIEAVAEYERRVAQARRRIVEARDTLVDRAEGRLPFPEHCGTADQRDAVLQNDYRRVVSERAGLKVEESLLSYERERLDQDR